jgi:arylsulfatase A-like enzyme
LVIITADHGETFDPSRPKRPINFYEDTQGIPLSIHVPTKMRDADPQWLATLRENRNRRVSHLDIVPTLLDLWERWPAKASRPTLVGSSLWKPIPADRVHISTSRGAILEPAVEGFAVYSADRKWVLDEKRGLQLFDLTHDPEEKAAITPSAAERQALDAILHAHPALQVALDALHSGAH